MTLFPFFADIEDKKILIVGGGSVAFEKYKHLKQFTDNICIVAKKCSFQALYNTPVRLKGFEISDLEGIDICIAATDDREVNCLVSDACKERGIPVNVVDDKELCTFVFPKLIKRGELCVAITTQGASPAYAARLGSEIEELIPEDIEQVLDRMKHMREIVPKFIKEQPERSKVYKLMLARLLEDASVSDERLLELINL